MPQDSEETRVSGQMAEVWGSRQWLTQLLSDWRVANRGKLAATAALAMLRDRIGRRLLGRLAIVSVFFIYQYLVIVKVIVGCLVLAEVAARLIPLFTSCHVSYSSTQPNEERLAISNSAASSSSNYGGYRAGPNWGHRRQKEEIQNHLQRLAMAAASVDATSVSAVACVTPSLQHYREDERLAVDIYGTNGTITTMITASNTSSSSPAAAARNGHQELSSIVSSEHRRERRNPTEAVGQSVVIHFQLPIYVCDLTFWNDVRISVPTSSLPPSSSPSAATAGKIHQTRSGRDQASSSNSRRPSSAAAGLCYHIKMRMWVEMNRSLVEVGTPSVRKPCEDCLMGSHSVGKRRFACSYHDGRLEALDVHKNTFHAGRKLAILGSNSGLNFKFETALEQTPSRQGSSSGPASFQQRVNFALLPRTSKTDNQQKSSSRVGGGSGSRDKRQGGSGPGLLAAVFRRSSSDSNKVAAISKCSMEALYTLEDRRRTTGVILRC